jgi:hypothetical protein
MQFYICFFQCSLYVYRKRSDMWQCMMWKVLLSGPLHFTAPSGSGTVQHASPVLRVWPLVAGILLGLCNYIYTRLQEQSWKGNRQCGMENMAGYQLTHEKSMRLLCTLRYTAFYYLTNDDIQQLFHHRGAGYTNVYCTVFRMFAGASGRYQWMWGVWELVP